MPGRPSSIDIGSRPIGSASRMLPKPPRPPRSPSSRCVSAGLVVSQYVPFSFIVGREDRSAGPQHPNLMSTLHTLHGDILCDAAHAAMGMTTNTGGARVAMSSYRTPPAIAGRRFSPPADLGLQIVL